MTEVTDAFSFAFVYLDYVLYRKMDAQVRAAVEMYTEDWIIAHRRWV